MSGIKRKYEEREAKPNKRLADKFQSKKHTLDSDEEDNVDETNILDADDIEGEEEGVARQEEGGQRMTAFNMKEEMEEGHFDRDGHFIWNNEKEIRDNWLDNIDWQKIKNVKDKYKVGGEEGLGASSSDSEEEGAATIFDETTTYKKMLTYMQPKESVNRALKRLGGDNMKLSSVERLRRKKAGTLNNNEGVTNLTALANQLLTNTGNMDVYQETFEQIQGKIDDREGRNKKPVFDMFGDEGAEPSTSKEVKGVEPNVSGTLMWEFKWSSEDEKVEDRKSVV